MTTIDRTFSVGETPEIDVVLTSGDVDIRQGRAGQVDLHLDGSESALELLEIEQFGNTVEVHTRKGSRRRFLSRGINAVLTVPDGTRAAIKTASGNVSATVLLDEVHVGVASGDVRLEEIGGMGRVKSAAGDITVGQARGDLEIASASGDVRVDVAGGDLSVHTASGDVEVGRASGAVRVKSASGDVDVRQFAGAEFDVKSMAGDVRLGLVAGTEVDADISTLSGSIRNLVIASSGERRGKATVRVKTLSGDVVLRNAKDD